MAGINHLHSDEPQPNLRHRCSRQQLAKGAAGRRLTVAKGAAIAAAGSSLPAVWASTALSSGRVVVRGADVTGGKRGAAGRPVRAVKPTAAQAGVFIQRYGMRGRNDNDSGGATSPIPFTA